MMHVDVIKNDPLAGVCRLLATITADGDHVSIEPEQWGERIEQLAGPMNGHGPDEYIQLITDRLADATYVSVSEPHTDESCPFAAADEIGDAGAQRSSHLA